MENLTIVDFALVPRHSYPLISIMAIIDFGNSGQLCLVPSNPLLRGFTVLLLYFLVQSYVTVRPKAHLFSLNFFYSYSNLNLYFASTPIFFFCVISAFCCLILIYSSSQTPSFFFNFLLFWCLHHCFPTHFFCLDPHLFFLLLSYTITHKPVFFLNKF